jgi:hypothetical protein
MSANESDDDQTRSFTSLVAGTKVSHYTIMSKIGAGGLGEVYLAEDTVLYKLEIAIDSNFNFDLTIDSLMTNAHPVADSLTFGTHYWWRVSAFDNTGLSTMSSNSPDFWTWVLGDIDNSHTLGISDLVMLVDWMFTGGPPPYPLFVTDINGSCGVDISDLVYLVDYMFTGGPAPLVGCE